MMKISGEVDNVASFVGSKLAMKLKMCCLWVFSESYIATSATAVCLYCEYNPALTMCSIVDYSNFQLFRS